MDVQALSGNGGASMILQGGTSKNVSSLQNRFLPIGNSRMMGAALAKMCSGTAIAGAATAEQQPCQGGDMDMFTPAPFASSPSNLGKVVDEIERRVAVSSPPLGAHCAPKVFVSRPGSRRMTPVMSRQTSPSCEVISAISSPVVTFSPAPQRPSDSVAFELISEEFDELDSEALSAPSSSTWVIGARSRAMTDGNLHSLEQLQRASSPSSDLAAVLSNEASKLTVVGQKLCVEGSDGRQIVIFQGGADNENLDKQVKMLHQICSAVKTIVPEAWPGDDESPVATPSASSTCCICMEEVVASGGLECGTPGTPAAERHFVCDLCFESYVETQCSIGSSSSSTEDGNLYCPGRCDEASPSGRIQSARCSATYNSQDVARHTSREVFECYWLYRSRLSEQRIATEMEAAWKARADAEKRHSEAMIAKAELAELMTLKCPRCGQAFTDFQGCFALQCSRHLCRACFCGWCLQDCGKEPEACHRHVINDCRVGRTRCPEDPLFGKGEACARSLFEKVCQERRQVLLREYLGKLAPNIQTEVLQSARTELASLGLDIGRQAARSSSKPSSPAESTGVVRIPISSTVGPPAAVHQSPGATVFGMASARPAAAPTAAPATASAPQVWKSSHGRTLSSPGLMQPAATTQGALQPSLATSSRQPMQAKAAASPAPQANAGQAAAAPRLSGAKAVTGPAKAVQVSPESARLPAAAPQPQAKAPHPAQSPMQSLRRTNSMNTAGSSMAVDRSLGSSRTLSAALDGRCPSSSPTTMSSPTFKVAQSTHPVKQSGLPMRSSRGAAASAVARI